MVHSTYIVIPKVVCCAVLSPPDLPWIHRQRDGWNRREQLSAMQDQEAAKIKADTAAFEQAVAAYEAPQDWRCCRGVAGVTPGGIYPPSTLGDQELFRGHGEIKMNNKSSPSFALTASYSHPPCDAYFGKRAACRSYVYVLCCCILLL